MKRTMARLFLVWVVGGPIVAYFSFPKLLHLLENKARSEISVQCLKQTAGQPSTFDPAQPAIAQGYCDCLRDGVVLTRADVFALLRHEQPVGLNDLINRQAETCGMKLVHPGAKDAQVLYF